MRTPKAGPLRRKLLELAKGYAKSEGCEYRSALRDILTDLRHLADEHDLDFHALLDGSYDVYLEERNDEPGRDRKPPVRAAKAGGERKVEHVAADAWPARRK